jgi:ElaB/YqjD/DUF883 family membrane-anchored ribosome-binding protein
MSILNTKNSNDAIENLRQTSEAMLHSAVQSAENAIESGARLANDALHNRIDPMVDKMAATAQKLAKQSMDMATDAKEYAQHAINRASKASTQYVEEQPVRSVLIAAAVGAAVALLFTSMRSRNDVRRY